MPQLEIYNEKKELDNEKLRLVRSVWYFLGHVLLFLVTVLIFFALFSNNWQKTISEKSNINERFSEYYTFGIWFTCRHITVSWLDNNQDVYCSRITQDLGNYSTNL